jgi:heme-degrading monooxygenase HmoA
MSDRASGKVMSITIWDSEEALNASMSQADELRKRAASGTEIQSVQHYEIPLTVGTPTPT